ncbi:MAG: hypothetical protein ACPLPQ_01405 [Candidatus Saccharicenans sp.]
MEKRRGKGFLKLTLGAEKPSFKNCLKCPPRKFEANRISSSVELGEIFLKQKYERREKYPGHGWEKQLN